MLQNESVRKIVTARREIEASVDGFGRSSFDWGDGRQTFRLTHKEIAELEAKIDRGLMWLYRELERYEAKHDHIRHVFRLGLIGQGMEPPKAIQLVRHNIDERPNLIYNAECAKLILLPVLLEPKGDSLPKARRRKRTKDAGASPSPNYSEQPVQSASPSQTSGA